jgi:hypothetical protein
MDTERASSQRFKVAYVEDKKLPPLTVISKDFDEREDLLQFEKRMVAAGTKEDEMEAYRRDILRSMYFPIRITDTQTGNTYEVQKDRRTIIAKDKGGKILWKINPFVDGKLQPYRFKHPIIEYFGMPFTPLKSEARHRTLQVSFNSTQSGGIDINNGAFAWWGQD